jgi:ATP-dependent RNA helicase DDX52/ROK1
LRNQKHHDMDLFKLLTRSTKLAKAQDSRSIAIHSAIPSAGQNANPQLFGSSHDPTQPSVLGKRKRNQNNGPEDNISAEIDFFHSGPIKSIQNPEPSVVESKPPELAEEEIPLDLNEYKRILRTHKVKLSLLSQQKTPNAGKSKKSKTGSLKAKHSNDGTKLPLVYARPLSTFSQLSSRYGLRRRLFENIDSQGYSMPTEVQLVALPILMGEPILSADEDSPITGAHKNAIDLLTVAPTGSGKTLAFLIPLLNDLLDKRKSNGERKDGPYALIVAPTKELVSQIVNEGRKLALNTGLRITLIKKGMRVGSQTEQIVQDAGSSADENDSDGSDESDTRQTTPKSTAVKSDIIVATPMALLHALDRGSGNIATLSSVEHLVLDEADVLLDPLFQEQTLSIWKACSTSNLRTSLWSATMSSSIENLALSIIRARDSTPSTIIRLVIGLKDSALPTVSHKLIYAATEAGKLLALRQLLRPTAPSAAELTSSSSTTSLASELRPPFLVFTQTVVRAAALHSELRYDIPPEAGGSSRIAVLHADMSDSARSRVMAGFRRGEIWVIVTTDLLARGVDFRGLNGVVNYDVPGSAAAYVHRAGRTGRAGRRGGVVVTLYTKEDIPFVKPIANVIAASERVAAAEGDTSATGNMQKWLLDALPTPSKRDKKELKRKGLEMRRPGSKSALISTKAPDDRRRRNFKKDNSRKRREEQEEEQSEFEGFDD